MDADNAQHASRDSRSQRPLTLESNMAKKVWNLMYVVGNPAMFSRVTACAENPMSRADAVAGAEKIAQNGWRVWIEHHATAERIFESTQEVEHRAATAGAAAT